MTSTLTRQTYVPKAYVKLELPDLPEGCEVFRDPSALSAIAFGGKRTKPDWHYRFRSEDRLLGKIREWSDGIKQRQERVAERKAERSQPHDLKVGDVMVCSWGWEQTNIDYYECTAIRGKRQVVVRQIAAERIETRSMQGQCVPKPGHFIGDEQIKTVITYADEPSVKINGYATATRIKPIATVAGAKIYPVAHWTAYA
jgi:hypothetical protein